MKLYVVISSYQHGLGEAVEVDAEVFSTIDKARKALVERKREGKTYLLVPLTKNHAFVCKGDSIDVDGEHIKSEIFFRKDGAQWIEIDKETLSKAA